MDLVGAKGDIIGGGKCCHAENWLIIANYQSSFTYLSSRNHQKFMLLSPPWHRSQPLMMSTLFSPNSCPFKPPLSCNVMFQFYCWRRTLWPKRPDTICSVATFIRSIDTYFMISLTCIVCAEPQCHVASANTVFGTSLPLGLHRCRLDCVASCTPAVLYLERGEWL